MDMAAYLRFIAALILVLGLIVAAAWALRRYGLQMGRSLAAGGRGGRRLAVVEMLGLDAKRRLVLVRRDDREFLLLLGPAGDLVVDGHKIDRDRAEDFGRTLADTETRLQPAQGAPPAGGAEDLP